MKIIEVDEELYQYIAAQTQSIGESASDILRRLLNLPTHVTSSVDFLFDSILKNCIALKFSDGMFMNVLLAIFILALAFLTFPTLIVLAILSIIVSYLNLLSEMSISPLLLLVKSTITLPK